MGLCITRQNAQPLAANTAVMTSIFMTALAAATCSRSYSQHASQAADKGQQEQEQVPVSKAAVAVVRELIRGSGQQGTAVTASHHRGHHSRLVATLLLQELQVQLCGHRDLIASLV